MKTELTAKQKGYYREKALDTATRIRPAEYISASSSLNQNMQPTKTHASITKEILEQAEIIYDWLTA